jgi:hypothetical protein
VGSPDAAPNPGSPDAAPNPGSPDAAPDPGSRDVALDPAATPSRHDRRQAIVERFRELIIAIREGDDAMVEQLVLRISRSRRWLAPLALVVGAFLVLFQGLKLLVMNWRLTIVQLLPAMWIWVATYDLKVHVLHGKSLNVLRGPILIPLVLGVAAITVASFFLNAVFAFAITQPGVPKVRPAVADARRHLGPIVLSGGIVGIALGLAAFVVARAGRPWFALCLGIVIGVMMLCYVSVPSWLLGIKPNSTMRDKVATSAISGAVGAVVVTPPYLLSRLGILMLGSKILFIPGLVCLTVGATVGAGATSAVKAVKLSAKLVERPSDLDDRGAAEDLAV